VDAMQFWQIEHTSLLLQKNGTVSGLPNSQEVRKI
jgi:hypothetical protein